MGFGTQYYEIGSHSLAERIEGIRHWSGGPLSLSKAFSSIASRSITCKKCCQYIHARAEANVEYFELLPVKVRNVEPLECDCINCVVHCIKTASLGLICYVSWQHPGSRRFF